MVVTIWGLYMLVRVLQIFFILASYLLVPSLVHAVDFNNNKYDIYRGDVNGDGTDDIYLHGKQQFILLHSEISIPIIVPPQSAYIIDGVTEQTDQVDCSPTGCGGQIIISKFFSSSPRLQSPALSDQEILDLGLTLLVEGIDYFLSDFNQDNITDILLRAPDFDKAYIYTGSVANSAPSQFKEYTGQHSTLINDSGTRLSLKDTNGDGLPEIVIAAENSLYADTAIFGGGNYENIDYVLEASAPLPTTLVGSTNGAFRVNESGAATYSVSISMPEGIAGVMPSVSLDYSSLNTNTVVGRGWSLSAGGAITRCRSTLFADGQAKPIQLNNEDKFCLNGQRLILVSGTYGAPGSEYRTEIDAHEYIYAVGGTNGDPAYFDIIAKDGTLSRYGSANNASLDLGSKTLVWALSRQSDNFSNNIDYYYLGGSDSHRLDRIVYAGGESVIKFNYTMARPDIQKGYTAGYLTQARARLENITVSNNTHTFRRYNLSYLKATEDNRVSRLSRIQECTVSDALCLSPLEFDWQYQTREVSAQANFNFAPVSGGQKTLLDFKPTDINGDSCQDIIYGWYDQSDNRFYTGYSLSIRNCTDYSAVTNMLSKAATGNDDVYQTSIVDYNADGRQDLAIRYADDQEWRIHLATPDTFGNWNLNPTPVVTSRNLTGKIFVDINSDGLIDNLDDSEAILLKQDVNSPETAASHYHYATSQPQTIGGAGEVKAFGDFNGDGNVDYIKFSEVTYTEDETPNNITIETTKTIAAYIFTDTGTQLFWQTSTFLRQCRTCPPSSVGQISDTPMVADFNADNLADIVVSVGNQYRLYLSTGTGFASPIILPVLPSVIQHPNVNATLLPSTVDRNRDGFLDLFWHDRSANKLFVALWDAENETFSPPESIRNVADDNTYSYMDVNGDGADDLVELRNAYSSDREKRILFYLNQDDANHNLITSFVNNFGNVTNVKYERLNKTGSYARMEIRAQSQSQYRQCSYYEQEPGDLLGQLCEFREVNYDDFNRYLHNPLNVDSSSSEFGRPIIDLNSPTPIVTSVESSAPVAGNPNALNRVDYLYAEAKLQAGGRGFLGFKSLTSIDTQTGIYTTTEYRQDFPYIGMPTNTIVRTKEGKKLSEKINNYDLFQPNNVSFYQPKLITSTEHVYSTSTNTHSVTGDVLVDDSSPLATTVTHTNFDSFGNLLTSTTNVSGSFTDPDANSGAITINQSKSTINSYSDSTSISLHGKPFSYQQLGRLVSTSTSGERNGIAQAPRYVEFSYYSNGMLDEERIEPNSTNNAHKLVKKNFYDSRGNTERTEVTGWNGDTIETRESRVLFTSSTKRYADKRINAKGHEIEEILARNNFGAPTKIKGTNGIVTDVVFDSLGREISRTDNTATQNTSSSEYLNCSQVSPACPINMGVQYALRKSIQHGVTSVEYFDALGRTVRSASTSFDGRWVYVDTEYDALGRTVRVSEPYFSSPQYWTSTSYDILGRALRISTPASADGATEAVSTMVYSGTTSTTTNPDGQTKREIKNIFDEVIKVEDNVHDSANDYAYIRYHYDVEGNLRETAVHSAEGDIIKTTIDYDFLNRKTSMTDVDKGYWTYQYNAFGELIRQQDAKGQVIKNRYDLLGRIVKRFDYWNSSETSLENYSHWYYDGETDNAAQSIANAIGQVTAVVQSRSATHTRCTQASAQYCQYQTFDNYGRPLVTTTHINADDNDATPLESFSSDVSYDPITGRIDIAHDAMHGWIKDFSLNTQGQDIQSGVRNHYNSRGFLTHTEDLETGEELYRTDSVNERGQVTRAYVGPYSRTLYYDDATGRLEKQIAYIGGLMNTSETPDAMTIQHITYDWDIVGNLKSRHNQSSLATNRRTETCKKVFVTIASTV